MNQRIIPFDAQPHEALCQKASDLADRGRLVNALGMMSRAYEQAPDSDEAVLLYARLLTRARRHDDAMRVLSLHEHYQADPHPDLYFALATQYLLRHEYDRAQEYLYRFWESGVFPPEAEGILLEMREACRAHAQRQELPDAAREWGEAGDRAMLTGKTEEAITLYRQVLDAAPANNTARHHLLGLLLMERRYRQAQEVAREGCRQADDPLKACAELMVMCEGAEGRDALVKMLPEMTARAREAWKSEKEVTAPGFVLLVLGMLQKHVSVEEAVDFANRLQLQKAYDPLFLHQVAVFYGQAGHTTLAVQCWQRMGRIAPLDIEPGCFLQAAAQGIPVPAEYEPTQQTVEALCAKTMAGLACHSRAAAQWADSAAFRQRLRLLLRYGDLPGVKAACRFLMVVGDARARQALREIMLFAPGRETDFTDAYADALLALEGPGPLLVFHRGVYMAMTQCRRQQRKNPRGGQRWREARMQAGDAAAVRWGNRGRQTVDNLFRALFRCGGWPLPPPPEAHFERLVWGVLAATAVSCADYDTFHEVLRENPKADFWARRFLQSYTQKQNILYF